MGSPRQMFKKKVLAASVAALASVSYSAIAQDAPVEEVLVTGIRASLENAMDIKRDSSGVVDAISAEDIGKMPDANLAESLQRIAGVSISRTNGEGAQVTVRGIDPALNMVTLNGRVMPAVTNNGNTGDKSSRAYDFANLASESVSGVEVYKTGSATNAGGGLGASVNLKTIRPLDAGEKLSLGLKAVQDTTVYRGDKGSEITPEVSGVYSWVNDEDTFGIALTAAYQERDNVRSNAFVNNWQLQTAGAATATTSDGVLPIGASITNAPAPGQLYALPTDLRYALEENHRERTNSQLTVQFRPVEKLTATLDYTFSKYDLEAYRAQQSTWYGIGNITAATFDTGAAVATPIIYQETYDGNKDVSFAVQQFNSVSINNSLGLNLEWNLTDSFTLEFDYHDSAARNETDRPELGLNANIVTGEYSDWRSDLPVMGITFNDDSANGTNGNSNGIIDGGDVSGAMGTYAWDKQNADIEQIRLMGALEFDQFAFFNEGSLKFGVESREDVNHTLIMNGEGPRVTMGNWGGVDPETFGPNWPNYFSSRNFAEGFDQDSTSNPMFLTQGLQADFDSVVDALEHTYAMAQNAIVVYGDDPTTVDDPSTPDTVENVETYYYVSGLPAPGQDPWENRIYDLTPNNFNNFPDGKYKRNGVINVDRTISEEVQSFYVAFQGGFDIGGMEANLGLGVRYEDTKTTSESLVSNVTDLLWTSDDDWSQVIIPGTTLLSQTNSYDNVLPNIDFDISVTDDIKLRASYSTTMARPGYGQLQSETTINNVYLRQTTRGNPALVALESNNFDISAEWYYGDGSYVSAAYFMKDVSNFIGNTVVQAPAFGLTDLRNSDAFNDAVAGGLDPNADLQALHDEVCGSSAPCTSADYLAANPGETLPLVQWNQSQPINNEDASIDGLELSIQHWFGDSGFGMQANYTMVDSDLTFDDTLTTSQFALIGLSDTANLVAIYENYGFQARLAYNWRDEFLSSTTQGGNNAPGYTEAFSQIDLSLGYEVNESVSLTFEGLNITGEDYRVRGRSSYQMFNFEDLGARYAAGIRVTF